MVNFGCEKKICFAIMCFNLMIFKTKGQQCNITGSSTFAVLGKEFTWTCSIYIPPGQTINAVTFYRDQNTCASIGHIRGNCTVLVANDRYRYGCSSEFTYTLTIPAQNMTDYEQGSAWSCENVYTSMYRSPAVILNIANPPTVKPFSQQNIIEGRDFTVTCLAEPGNPNTTIFFWTKEDNLLFRQNGATLHLLSIQRTNSGIYRCAAENLYGNGEKGIHSQSMVLNVLYPPTVTPILKQNIIEGRNFTVTCLVIPGNPNSTTVFWTMDDDSLFRDNGATLHIPNVQRTRSGIYRCTAENLYISGEKGTHSQSVVLNVLYQPSIEEIPLEIVNESSTVSLKREISSNPLSNVSWYRGTELLITQTSATTATYYIEKAKCTDTHNFTLLANNGIKGSVSVLVELIVNCMPKPETTRITLGVTDTSGIDISVRVLAYPSPQYELQNENGTINNKIQGSMYRNAVNNFTLQFKQNLIDQSDFGIYHLIVSNPFGTATIFILVIPQRRPNIPSSVTLTCEVTSARLQWLSSFDGGERQTFTVVAINVQYGTSYSERISDMGENIVHSKSIHNLQPSTLYVFFVSAQNSQGSAKSENISCTTQNQDTGSLQTAVILAGSVGGTLTVIVIVLVTVFFVYRRYTCICVLQKRNENKAVTMKEDTSYYTTIAEQGNRERNVYESLQKPNANSSEEQDIHKSQKKKSKKKDPTTQSSKDYTIEPAEVYVNTSFM